MSRGVYRGIFSVLQRDRDFRKLSPAARHTLLSMRMADYVGIACFWRYDVSLIAADTGYDAVYLEQVFIELEAGKWIRRDGEYMWIRNGLRYDPTVKVTGSRQPRGSLAAASRQPRGSLAVASDKHRVGVLRAIAGIPRIPMLATFCRYYHLPYPFDTHPNGHRRVIDTVFPPRPNPNTETESESSGGLLSQQGSGRKRRPAGWTEEDGDELLARTLNLTVEQVRQQRAEARQRSV